MDGKIFFKGRMKTQRYFRSGYINAAYPDGHAAWDTVVYESENFMAIPSVGSLVPGWLLIVPKTHLLSMGSVSAPHSQELVTFLETTVARLEAAFGSVCIFEHGAVRRATSVGCGVDHAHIHLVPTDHNLLRTASRLAPEINWESVSSIKAAREFVERDVPYLFFQQSLRDKPYIGTATQLPSQLFRRAIAESLNRPETYDWKGDFGLDNIESTLSTLLASSKDAHQLLSV